MLNSTLLGDLTLEANAFRVKAKTGKVFLRLDDILKRAYAKRERNREGKPRLVTVYTFRPITIKSPAR
jgi:hypothetical protein